MIELYQETDPWVVIDIARHPAIWPRVSEQGIDPARWSPSDDEVWLTLAVDCEIAGCWLIESRNGVCAVVHPMILPEFRAYSARSEAMMCGWMKKHSSAKKLIAEIPAIYRDVIWFASRCGWVREGLLSQAAMRDDRLVDVIIMGKSLWAR